MIHKTQGLTLDTVLIDIGKELSAIVTLHADMCIISQI